MKKEERVLIIQNNASSHFGIGDYFHIQSPISEGWKDEVMKEAVFVDRWMAEQDTTILQLIPYIVCITEDNKIFSYQRKGGGEGRLEGKYSIGIGGHVNDTDMRKDKKINWDVVKNGAARELSEELTVDFYSARKLLKEVGILYTPTDSGQDEKGPSPRVGEVHLGIIYIVKISPKVLPRSGQGLINPSYIEGRPVDLDCYETWSKMILQEIDTIIHMNL